MAFSLNYFTPTYNTPSLKALVSILNNSFSEGNSYAAYGLSAPVVTNNVLNYNASTIVNSSYTTNNTTNYAYNTTNNTTNNTFNSFINNSYSTTNNAYTTYSPIRYSYGGFWGGYGYGYGGYGYRGIGW